MNATSAMKSMPTIALILAIASWVGLAAVVFVIMTAMGQWDIETLRPFEIATIAGTYVCGGVSAVLSAFLLWRQRRIGLFIFSWLPIVLVGGLAIYARSLR